MKNFPSRLDLRLDEVVARLVILDVEQSWLRAELAGLREVIVQSHADSAIPPSQLDKLYEAVVQRRFEELQQNVVAQLPIVAAGVRRAAPN